MKVRINDISNIKNPIVYIAENVGQCKGQTDMFVFEAVEQTGTIVTVGKVIGEPVK